MAGRLLLALPLLALALAAQAETYKWVDEHGVTNYSNTPPPAKSAKSARAVEDRISTIPADPALKAAASRAPSYYSQAVEAEWLQRQRLMAMKEASMPACPYPYSDCYEDPRMGSYYPYFLPVAAARPFRSFRAVSHHRTFRTTSTRSMLLR